MLAVATSDVRPLPTKPAQSTVSCSPHAAAVPPRRRPGRRKTIMAGLYIKELILRDDVKQCLIVAPAAGRAVAGRAVLQVRAALRPPDQSAHRRQREPQRLRDQPAADRPHGSAVPQRGAAKAAQGHRVGPGDRRRGHRMGRTTSAPSWKDQTLPTRRAARQNHPPPATDDRHPHSGKEEDFQLFLTLLDRDRFEGKHKKTADTSASCGAWSKKSCSPSKARNSSRSASPRPCPTS
ncbi:putative type III restriction enzyme, res subunit [Mycobacterium kansasii]|uniref:Putative type III restriction enzyme, res subunit n=1 Tax=Mycobacterium kansasii TaxID=1768 RepID=A0A1V3WBH5_MYCKA|nr:putative type III restriction enzyme, res subunit [Mycobacterium kansasii]